MKKKMQGFAKKGTAVFFKCLMICFLFLLQLNLPDTVIHAVSGFGDAPDITVKFAYKSGGIIPTDNKGNNIANTVLVGREGSSSAIVDLQIDPQFSSGEITAPYFTLDLPYFYYDASGTLVSTFDIDAVPEDSKENGEPKMGLQAIVRDNKDYSVDKNTVFKGGSDKINKNVIRGDALTIQSGTPSAITLEFVFYGDVPENASCIATVGGGYANYTDTNGNTTEYNHYVQTVEMQKTVLPLFVPICNGMHRLHRLVKMYYGINITIWFIRWTSSINLRMIKAISIPLT